jgi:hypothetical protein
MVARMSDTCKLVICLSDGAGEQEYEYASRKHAIRRYELVYSLLSGGAYRERNIKIKYAYIIIGNRKEWLRR